MKYIKSANFSVFRAEIFHVWIAHLRRFRACLCTITAEFCATESVLCSQTQGVPSDLVLNPYHKIKHMKSSVKEVAKETFYFLRWRSIQV